MNRIAGLLIGLLLTATAVAQDVNLNDVPEAPGGKAKIEAVDPTPHAVISQDSSWATEVVMVICVMFVAAMLVGSVYKMPVPVVEAHGDDDQGHGGHGHDDHGHGAHGHDDHGHSAQGAHGH